MSSLARKIGRARRHAADKAASAEFRRNPPPRMVSSPIPTPPPRRLHAMDLLRVLEFDPRREPYDRHREWESHPEGERGWMSHPRGEPNRPDKGQRDGACNRTACQDSLLGLPRWSMRDYGTDGRLYYCVKCAADFTASDLQFGDPWRISIHPGDEL